MKKIIIIIIIFLFIPNIVFAQTDNVALAVNARNAILIEVSTGKILFEKNKDEQVSIASLTKMMSQILILEAVENGIISWDEKVTTSSNAAGFGGTQIYLEPGEIMTVKDLMKGISIASANDATVALAERIAGTEEKFVEKMNEKAKELKLKNTNFTNCTGLDQEGNYSSAYDLSIIARELLKHDEILEFTSIYEDYLRQDTSNKFWLVNTNKLVRLYEGTDGLKTGFTNKAKYCMAVTTKRKDMRLLAIVLGEEVSKVRNKETQELLEYGFNNYEIKTIRKENEKVDEININKGNIDKIEVVLKDNVVVLKKKSDNDKKYTEKIILNDIKLPIKKNDKVGVLELYSDNKKIASYDLISNNNVKKKSIISIYLDNLKNILLGNI